MGWIVALAVLILLAMLPLGVLAGYDSSGVLIRILVGPVRLTVIPARKKKNDPVKHNKPDTEEQKTVITQEDRENPLGQPTEEPKKEEKGGSIKDFLPLLELFFDLIGDFTRKLRVNNLEVKLILAGSDPADLAINYGRTWSAIGNLMPRLERFLVIKKRNVQVECDFTASQTTINATVELTITLGRLLALAVRYGIRGLCELLKIRKKQKAVQYNEQ